jgi:adenylate cyclase
MAEPVPDFAAEGLLEGLEDADERAARLALLEELHDAGVRLDDLRRAVEEQRLPLVPVELVLGGKGQYTAEEVARMLGVDHDWLARQRQAVGLPAAEAGAAVYSEEDVEAARRSKDLRDAGLPDEAALELTRVMGQSSARVAEALRTFIGQSFLRPDDNERDLGRRWAEVARALGPHLGSTLEWMVNIHLREQLRDDYVARAELESGRALPNAREVAVAFTDLVGFTRLGARLPVDELGSLAGRLADLADEVAEPPVELVKTIGDAAMLVSPEPPALLESVLELIARADAEGDDFPQLRGGVAAGPALRRAGDWYGHTVNLASRVTDVARPGSVLATREVRDPLKEDYQWSFAGERRLKGIGEVALFRARRLPPPAEGE